MLAKITVQSKPAAAVAAASVCASALAVVAKGSIEASIAAPAVATAAQSVAQIMFGMLNTNAITPKVHGALDSIENFIIFLLLDVVTETLSFIF